MMAPYMRKPGVFCRPRNNASAGLCDRFRRRTPQPPRLPPTVGTTANFAAILVCQLLVNSLFAKATAYYLLQPLFSSKRGVDPGAQTASEAVTNSADWLASDNWGVDAAQTAWFHGATLGHGQELSHLLHPHLNLQKSMIHMPMARPGDCVAWHCDTIHSVDKTHAGKYDSSVLYIPACPMTEDNANYPVRQRENFVNGTSSPDFSDGDGDGESEHAGLIKAEHMQQLVGDEECQAMGLKEWDSDAAGLGPGEGVISDRANKIWGSMISYTDCGKTHQVFSTSSVRWTCLERCAM
jgi:hypothetical protein